MIRSMTGFGRARFSVAGRVFEVEVRSVNHRHLDARARLPRPLAAHESVVKDIIKSRLERGKVDLTVTLADGAASTGELQIDREVADQYLAAARELAEGRGIAGELGVTSLLGMPGVARFVETTLPAEELEAALEEGVGAALDGLCAMRASEGAALAAVFETQLARVEELVAFFEERAGGVLEAAVARLRKRTEQIRQETGLLDEARLHQEIVIAADRLDIQEELVRLRSHLAQFRAILGGDRENGPVGRRLDFLLQEFGREANTVGSKANDAELAHGVVELKAEIERIREQVQNVE